MTNVHAYHKKNVSDEMWDILKMTLGSFRMKGKYIGGGGAEVNILFCRKSKLPVLNVSNSGDNTPLSVFSLQLINMWLFLHHECSANTMHWAS